MREVATESASSEIYATPSIELRGEHRGLGRGALGAGGKGRRSVLKVPAGIITTSTEKVRGGDLQGGPTPAKARQLMLGMFLLHAGHLAPEAQSGHR